MRSKLAYSIALLLICFFEIAFCQFQMDTYAIHNVNIIDVENKSIIKDQTIVVENEAYKKYL